MAGQVSVSGWLGVRQWLVRCPSVVGQVPVSGWSGVSQWLVRCRSVVGQVSVSGWSGVSQLFFMLAFHIKSTKPNLLIYSYQVCGIGLMGVGIYVQLKIGDFAELSTVKYVTGSILIIVVGAFIALVAFFGCCGAVKENTCFLGIVSYSNIAQRFAVLHNQNLLVGYFYYHFFSFLHADQYKQS